MLALSVPIYITEPTSGPAESKGFSLATAQNHLRPLFLFAPHGSDVLLLKQLELLRTPDLLERNVIVVPLPVQGASLPPEALETSVFGSMRIDEAAGVRHRFHIAPAEFTVLLLGKDGGEKFRSHVPVAMDELNELIDAMPARQHEIKSRH